MKHRKGHGTFYFEHHTEISEVYKPDSIGRTEERNV